MATLQPTVLENVNVESFLQHVLDNHGPASVLVVCSTKETFLQQLQSAVSSAPTARHNEEPATLTGNEQASATDSAPAIPAATPPPHKWTIPTLRLLASAQTLKLAFCPDVTHLRGYLAAYVHRNVPSIDGSTTPPRIMAILNFINVHRPTSNFSAQGLNRTFSVAVEAAFRSGSKLVLAECKLTDSEPTRDEEVLPFADEERHAPVPALASVWDEEVSILNVTTKSFGAGERGWVGRTVKLRAVAGRWCRFERLGVSER